MHFSITELRAYAKEVESTLGTEVHRFVAFCEAKLGAKLQAAQAEAQAIEQKASPLVGDTAAHVENFLLPGGGESVLAKVEADASSVLGAGTLAGNGVDLSAAAGDAAPSSETAAPAPAGDQSTTVVTAD